MAKRQFIDLSLPVVTTPYGSFPWAEITYISHRENFRVRRKNYGVPRNFFRDEMHAAHETIHLCTHVGTHLDAPWHYGPTCEGKPSKTIDEIPLEWCYGDGVVLDLTHKKPNDFITSEDLKKALSKIGYTLKPYDIVLLRTDITKKYPEPGFAKNRPGPGREVTLWLIEQGIRVMGIDAPGWERSLALMVEEYKSGKPKGEYWQAHLVGREREYCQIEGLANLDAIPKPYGFKVAVFPIKIYRGSGAWIRAVAILEEE